MPADANQNGDIFGGWIMSQVDIAGGTAAGRIARGRVATVAVKEFVFKQPVQIGDLVFLLRRPGESRQHFDHGQGRGFRRAHAGFAVVVKVTEATLTYVAIDRSGRPRAVPKN